jgi:hypothetical protein
LSKPYKPSTQAKPSENYAKAKEKEAEHTCDSDSELVYTTDSKKELKKNHDEKQTLSQYSNREKTHSFINNNRFTNKFSSMKNEKEPEKFKKEEEENKNNSKKITEVISIWEKTIGKIQHWFKNQQNLERIHAAFKNHFNQSLEEWRTFCRKIASSKFLMGETKSNFKIWIQWAIKPEIIQRILENGFSGGDRTVSMEPEISKKTQSLDQKLEKKYMKLSHKKQKKYIVKYLRSYAERNPAIFMAFCSKGLKEPFLKSSFKFFVLNLWKQKKPIAA